MQKQVIKRNGDVVPFDEERIISAITKAANATNMPIEKLFIERIIQNIQNCFEKTISVEDIQNIIESTLLSSQYINIGKNYIIYRKERETQRKKENTIDKVYNDIIDIADNDIKNENANMNGNTPAGQMMKFASETTKAYTDDYLIKKEYSEAHKNGLIHIHDKDYYPTKSLTCCQLDLAKLFENGFDTAHGHLRAPNSIKSYAALAAIVFQTNQNEMHGGQSFQAFDYFMAPGVKKSFAKYYKKYYKRFVGLESTLDDQQIILSNKGKLNSEFYQYAYEDTLEECNQAMESFIANMNSMHSRGKQNCLVA